MFTMEIEKDNDILYLGVCITKKDNGTFGHRVYKPTQIDRYLHANSHYFPSQKLRVISNLVTQDL